MKKFYLFCGLALCMLTVSCSKDSGKEDPVPPVPVTDETVCVIANAADEIAVWQTGATVSVNGVESSAIDTSCVGTLSGVFTVEKVKAPFVVVAPFKAYEVGNIVSVPDIQKFVAGDFDHDAYVLYGYAEKLDEVQPEEPVVSTSAEEIVPKTVTVDMQSFCGVVSLPLTVADGVAVNVKSVEMTAGNDAEALAGSWKFDESNLRFNVEKKYDTVSLDCGEGVALGAEPVEFRLVVPAGRYTQGVFFVIEDAEGHKDVCEFNNELVVAAGQVSTLDATEFHVIEKGDATLNITINEAGIKWAAGDQVVINGQLSSVVADAEVGTSTAVFNVSNVARPYKVLYPQDLYTTSGRLRLYNEQRLLANECDREALAMVGYASSNEVTMNNVCGLIKIPVVNKFDEDNITITRIDIRSNDGSALCGKFNINYRNATISTVSAVDELSLVPEEGSKGLYLPVGSSVDLYAVVPAGSFPKGLTLDVYTDVSNKLDIAVSPAAGLKVTRGEETAIETVEYAEVQIDRITTPEEFVALTTAINRGRTDRFKNAAGEIVLANDIDLAGFEIPQLTGEDGAGFVDVFNGNNFAIKNLSIAQTLFTKNAGTIKNVVFDNCAFGVSVVESNEGKINNVVLNACTLTAPVVNTNGATAEVSGVAMNAGCDVTFPAPTAAANFGFIVGTNAGLVTKCTNAIVYEKEIASTPKATVNFGGIVGASTGLVSDCSFSGTFDMSIAAPTSSQYNNFGGVVGFINGAKDQVLVSGCSNSGKVKVCFATKTMFATGGVVGGTTSTAKALNNYGVVENCENTGWVGMQYKSGGSGAYPVCGGVCGYIEGYIKDCNNRGTIAMECNGASSSYAWTAAKVAGVAGAVNMGASNCHNYGTLEFVKGYYAGGTEGNRFTGNVNVGCWAGVIASAGSWDTSINSVFEDCTNEADLVFAPGSTTGTPQFAFGGVFGWLNGTAKNCHNKKSVVANTNVQYVNLGGISAGGNAHFEGCNNNGDIVLNANDLVVPAKWFARVGGITGWATAIMDKKTKAVPINAQMSHCVNTGKITINGGSATSSNISYVGGIYGTRVNMSKAGSVTVSDCENTGVINTPDGFAKLQKGHITGDDNDL